MTLTQFLLARIDEDETVSRDAYDGDRWHVESDPDGGMTWVAQTDPSGGIWRVAMANVNPALHMARHDPARALADIAAKRQIVEHCDAEARCSQHGKNPIDDCDECVGAYHVNISDGWVLRYLALPYADHPDYRPEWRP